MEILKWGMLAFLVLPVPFILGMIPVKYMDKAQKTPAMTYLCGCFLSFAVFEVTAVPFILLEKSFTALVIAYTAIIVVLFVYALSCAKGTVAAYIEQIKAFRAETLHIKAGWAAAIIVIGMQMAYAVMFEYYDGDDAYYIAMAVLTDTFDTMYLRDAYSGYLRPLDARHALSPTPVYQAWLSRLSGIAPAAVAHTMLAAAWLLLMYCVISQICAKLFDRDKRKYRPVFMIFIALWFAFGNISLYTAETFAMTRTWQGKGLMAGTVIPALFLCFLNLAEEKVDKGSFMLLVCVVLSAVFATSVSFMIIPTAVGLAAVFIGIKKREIKTPALMLASCVPCILLGGIYLVMR